MDVAAVHFPRHRHEAKGGDKGDGVLEGVADAGPFRAALEQIGGGVAAAEDHRHRIGEMQPHAEQAQPGEELHHGQPPHRDRQMRQGRGNFLQQMRRPAAGGLFAAKLLQVLRGVLRGGKHGPQHGAQESDRSDVEGYFHVNGQPVGAVGLAAHVKPIAQDIGQQPRHDRAHADEETLHGETQAALFLGQFVGDKGAEGFHRHVDRRIQHPEEQRGHVELRQVRQQPVRQQAGIRHQDQRKRTQNRADQKVGPPPAERTPGAVAHRADDRLDDETGERRRQPEPGNLIIRRSQIFVDGAHVGHLQAPAELDAQKTKAHVPDFREGQGAQGFHGAGGSL